MNAHTKAIIDFLQEWRNEDQQDWISLHRSQVIHILEELKELQRTIVLLENMKGLKKVL